MRIEYISITIIIILNSCYFYGINNKPLIVEEIKQLDNNQELLGFSDKYYVVMDGYFWKIIDIKNEQIIRQSFKFSDNRSILLNDMYFIFTVNRQHPLIEPYKKENEIFVLNLKSGSIKQVTNSLFVKEKLSLDEMHLTWIENEEIHIYDLNKFEELNVAIDSSNRPRVYSFPKYCNNKVFWVEEQKANNSVIMSIKFFDIKSDSTNSIVNSNSMIYDFDVNDQYVIWTQTNYDTIYMGNNKNNYYTNFEVHIYAYDRLKKNQWLISKPYEGVPDIQISNHYVVWTIRGACDSVKPFGSGLYVYDLKSKTEYQINNYVEQWFWIKNNEILVKGISDGCSPINEIYYLTEN